MKKTGGKSVTSTSCVNKLERLKRKKDTILSEKVPVDRITAISNNDVRRFRQAG